MNFHYFMPTRILFGPGQVKNLHKQTLPGKKALIIISNGTSTRKYGYLDTVINELVQAGVGYMVFDQIQPNPTRSNVMAGAACAKENGCDFVIGLGGGSCLDASKAIAAMATNQGDLWDYIRGGTGKGKALTEALLPIVNISTTAGTGSEADAWGVITNEDTQEKIGFGGRDDFYPVLSVVDPEMILSVPPQYTAYQGFDAIFHSIEGYLSKAGNGFTDMCALETIACIAGNLPKAVKDGGDLAARTQVAFGNTLSGFVMSVGGTSSQHSLEHALSASHPELPHGAGLIMISQAYFTHFAKTGAVNERMIRMAKVMGKTDAEEAMDFVRALAELQKECGVDDLKMSDYGIQKINLPQYAKNARATMGGLFMIDPVPLSDEEAAAILVNAYR